MCSAETARDRNGGSDVKKLQNQDSLLNSIERAMDEKMRAGRANEEHHGLVARVANATPPIDETFRQTLRARVLARETGRTELGGVERLAQPINRRRFALVALAVALIVASVLSYGHTPLVEWREDLIGRFSSQARLPAEDFDLLAQELNRFPAPRTVVFYPDQASPIAERVRHKTVPLVLGEDTRPAAVQGVVDALLPSSGFVDLVTVSGQEDDAMHQVRATMEQTLYRLYHASGQADVQLYGALERNTFLVGSADLALEPIEAFFENGIELAAGAVLDEPQAGMPLRVALEWRVQAPVSDSVQVFVHVQRDEFELVAQRDAVPGNGLFPVEEWRPGELVREQFALLLPPEMPVGEYEIQVGIYDATTQMRHSLVEPGAGTFVVIQKWSIDGAGSRDRQVQALNSKQTGMDCVMGL
jgi:hypothetical protein